jgi:hypothetical protein
MTDKVDAPELAHRVTKTASEQASGSALDEFVAHENVMRFTRLLDEERNDEARRQVLLRLLTEARGRLERSGTSLSRGSTATTARETTVTMSCWRSAVQPAPH